MHLFGRAWWTGIATGTILTIMVFEPRLSATLMLVLLLIVTIEHFVRRGLPRQPETLGTAFAGLIVFAGWSMLTAAWSPAPWHSLLKPVFLILMTVAVWLAIRTVSTATRPFAHYFGEGALTAIILGYILVAFEILTDQLITRTIMSAIPAAHENIAKHVKTDTDGAVIGVSKANLNRRMAILTWLLWPAVMLALHDPSRIRRIVAFAALIGGAGVILLFGSHQSSQIAIIGGLIVFGLAWVNLNMMRAAVAGGWVIAVVLAVPLALMAFQADLHNASWLFKSAQHRVVIWGTTAEEVLKKPLLGVGADATREAMKSATKTQSATKTPKGKRDFRSRFANHAHNAYLQVWYELGAIGAAIFLGIGLLVLQAITGMKAALQPAALALFVTTALLIAFSYSLFQVWFMAALAFAVIVFAFAVRKRADQIAHPGTGDVPEGI